MKRIIAAAVLISTLSSCLSQQETKIKCGSVVCTEMFVSISANLIATKNSEIDFKNYKVINLATGKEVHSQAILADQPNTLVIADDSKRKEFSEKGDKLQLQVTRKDDKVVTADYVIAGGPCACHIAKLSGPDQVDLDN